MTGRAWQHRSDRNGGHTFGRGADQDIIAQFSTRIRNPNALAAKILEVVATHHGEPVEDLGAARATRIDWDLLGWPAGQTEHDQFIALQRHKMRRLDPRAQEWVRSERERAQIPNHAPFSVDDALTIASLIDRAPIVLAQDLAAEGTAA